jgi:hypothetical protein
MYTSIIFSPNCVKGSQLGLKMTAVHMLLKGSQLGLMMIDVYMLLKGSQLGPKTIDVYMLLNALFIRAILQPIYKIYLTLSSTDLPFTCILYICYSGVPIIGNID